MEISAGSRTMRVRAERPTLVHCQNLKSKGVYRKGKMDKVLHFVNENGMD
jgi:hypothetical protein